MSSAQAGRVIEAFCEQLEALKRTEELARDQLHSLQDPDTTALQQLTDELEQQLETVELVRARLVELVGPEPLARIAELSAGWNASQRTELQELGSRTGETVQRLLELNSASEAVASRSLLLARYCLDLLTGRKESGQYDSQPSIYSQRG
jgi:flagellar biosynthesis/type III secretory pathway chaperone